MIQTVRADQLLNDLIQVIEITSPGECILENIAITCPSILTTANEPVVIEIGITSNDETVNLLNTVIGFPNVGNNNNDFFMDIQAMNIFEVNQKMSKAQTIKTCFFLRDQSVINDLLELDICVHFKFKHLK